MFGHRDGKILEPVVTEDCEDLEAVASEDCENLEPAAVADVEDGRVLHCEDNLYDSSLQDTKCMLQQLEHLQQKRAGVSSHNIP